MRRTFLFRQAVDPKSIEALLYNTLVLPYGKRTFEATHYTWGFLPASKKLSTEYTIHKTERYIAFTFPNYHKKDAQEVVLMPQKKLLDALKNSQVRSDGTFFTCVEQERYISLDDAFKGDALFACLTLPVYCALGVISKCLGGGHLASVTQTIGMGFNENKELVHFKITEIEKNGKSKVLFALDNPKPNLTFSEQCAAEAKVKEKAYRAVLDSERQGPSSFR